MMKDICQPVLFFVEKTVGLMTVEAWVELNRAKEGSVRDALEQPIKADDDETPSLRILSLQAASIPEGGALQPSGLPGILRALYLKLPSCLSRSATSP